MKSPEVHVLPDGGWCPNNPACPLLVYRDCLWEGGEKLASRFEEIFERNGWPPAWRYTIFDYPHFHSTSHEVIGIFRGEAHVRFGDTVGFTARLSAGDVVVIPAGISHQRLWQTIDFEGVGAYPAGCRVDEIRKDTGRPVHIGTRLATLEVPPDPLEGVEGPLPKIWKSCGDCRE